MREYMQNKATGEPYKRSIRKSDQRFCGCIFLSCDVRHGGAGLFRRSDVGEIIPDRAQRDGCGDIQNGVLLHKDGGNADKKAAAVEAMRQPRLEKMGAYQKAKNAAIEPMTCSDGQTFVFVSNT